MADWIVWQKGLCEKPEILRLAATLGVTRFDAAARCMKLWEWWDANSTDGFAPGMTAQMLSEAVGLPGTAEALLDRNIGWLMEDKAGLHFPNWERWNLESTKKRLQNNRIQARWRRRQASAEST